MTTQALKMAAVAGLVLAVVVFASRMLSVRPTEPSTRGLRGRNRARARIHNSMFAALEPLVRHLGGMWALAPVPGLRGNVERLLQQSGYFLGIDANEYLAISTLATLAGAAALGGCGAMVGNPVGGTVVGAAMGALLVKGTVSGERSRRFRDISRQLPGEIDLAAMCMHAGMDMPSALSLLVEQGQEGDDLCEEFNLILQELELGRTRAEALSNFADRVPTESVQEFVGAVVQAEEKGTPPAETLKIQAGMLRMRRSVLAEEAASRAGVMMMIPLMMLLASILIVLFGSFALETNKSGFFS